MSFHTFLSFLTRLAVLCVSWKALPTSFPSTSHRPNSGICATVSKTALLFFFLFFADANTHIFDATTRNEKRKKRNKTQHLSSALTDGNVMFFFLFFLRSPLPPIIRVLINCTLFFSLMLCSMYLCCPYIS